MGLGFSFLVYGCYCICSVWMGLLLLFGCGVLGFTVVCWCLVFGVFVSVVVLGLVFVLDDWFVLGWGLVVIWLFG